MVRIPSRLVTGALIPLPRPTLVTPVVPAAAAAAATFSTTPTSHTKTIIAAHIPTAFVPPYPYGERRLYKQSNKGLYGLTRIRFGNHVAQGRNPHKHRRTWKPNVHLKRMWSASLGAWVKTKMTIRVFRTILKDKQGGLDAYLLKDSPQRIKELGPGGWKLRWLVMQTPAVRAAWATERAKLGLPEKPAQEVAIQDKEAQEMVQIAVDYATPGPLSKVTRDLLQERAMAVHEQLTGEEFTIGETEDIDGAKEEGKYEKEYISATDGVEKVEGGGSEAEVVVGETPKPTAQ